MIGAKVEVVRTITTTVSSRNQNSVTTVSGGGMSATTVVTARGLTGKTGITEIPTPDNIDDFINNLKKGLKNDYLL